MTHEDGAGMIVHWVQKKMEESEIKSLIGKLEDRSEFGTVLKVKGDKDRTCHFLRLP